MQGPVSFKFVESFRPRPLGEAHTTFFQQSPQKELLCFIILLLPDILFCKGRLRTLVSTVKSTSSLLPEALRCGGGPDYLPLSRSGFLALGTDESERPNHVGLIDFLQALFQAALPAGEGGAQLEAPSSRPPNITLHSWGSKQHSHTEGRYLPK